MKACAHYNTTPGSSTHYYGSRLLFQVHTIGWDTSSRPVYVISTGVDTARCTRIERHVAKSMLSKHIVARLVNRSWTLGCGCD